MAAKTRNNIHESIPPARGRDFAAYGVCQMCAKFYDYSRSGGVPSIDLACEIRRTIILRDSHSPAWPEQWRMSDGGVVCEEFETDYGLLRELIWLRYCVNRVGRPDPCYACEYSRCVRVSGEWRCAHPKNRHSDRYPEIRVAHTKGRSVMICDVGRPSECLANDE